MTPKPQANTLDEIFVGVYKDMTKGDFQIDEKQADKLWSVICSRGDQARAFITETRIDQVKKPILEYQANELEGKGYDFYFALRTELDRLTELKENK